MQSRIQRAVELLTAHPLSGQLTSHRALRKIVMTHYPYLIFYRVTDDEVVT